MNIGKGSNKREKDDHVDGETNNGKRRKERIVERRGEERIDESGQ